MTGCPAAGTVERYRGEVGSLYGRGCVVIGAGVLGACVADRLAGAGARVTLLDQDQPGRATSRWSFAWLNANDKAPRAYHDLNHAGLRAWASLAPGLAGDAWYRPVGHLDLAPEAELAARVERLRQWGYAAQLVDPAAAAELEPSLLPGAARTAGWFGEEGYLLTEPLIDRLVTRAVSRGAVLRTGAEGRVTGLDAAGVRTASGAYLAADDIICCVGRWSEGLAALAGASCPVPLVAWDTPGATAPGLVVRAGPVTALGPAARSAAWRTLGSWIAASACGRCPPTASPSSGACPVRKTSTWRSRTAASRWPRT